jgi:imidazolonepropionase-like amidohydrolase
MKTRTNRPDVFVALAACASLGIVAFATFASAQAPAPAPTPAPASTPPAPPAATLPTVAFVNARLFTMQGDGAGEIERGTLVVRGSTILSVGDATKVDIPAGATRIDLAGKTIMPGIVDTHSHIGGIGGADGSGPIQPDVRVFDSINVKDSGFKRALAGGLTTLNIMPGSGHLLSGQTVYLKLRAGRAAPIDAPPGASASTKAAPDAQPTPTAPTPVSIEELFFPSPAGMSVPMGGLKMANGTNPMREAPFSATRGKHAALIRDRYIKAQEYRDKRARAGDDAEKQPTRDIGLEALVECLNGVRIIHHHTHRADDIATVLRFAQEFKTRVVLHHVSEAWKVADLIASTDTGWGNRGANSIKGTPCSVILVDSPGGKLEASEMSYATAGVLERAGVTLVMHTDDWITDSRLFLRMAALAVRGGSDDDGTGTGAGNGGGAVGLSRAGALRALTINGAKMLDLAERIGSLETGKDADFVILSGDPLSVYTKVEQTWVEGRKVFDRSNPADRLYATGGFGAGHDQSPYFCCFDHSAVFQFGGQYWQGAGQSTNQGTSQTTSGAGQ